jgi:hypothetical protein
MILRRLVHISTPHVSNDLETDLYSDTEYSNDLFYF